MTLMILNVFCVSFMRSANCKSNCNRCYARTIHVVRAYRMFPNGIRSCNKCPDSRFATHVAWRNNHLAGLGTWPDMSTSHEVGFFGVVLDHVH